MSVQSVERAVALMREVGRTPGGLVDLAARVDLPTSTAARLLSTLEASGALSRDAGGCYRVGPEIRAMNQSMNGVDVLDIARPHMTFLADELNEAVGFSIPGLTSTTTRLMVSAPQPVQAEDWTGTEIPLHGGCIGLVTLAARSDLEVENYVRRELAVGNDNTITDPETIRHRITQIRSGEPLWTHGEWVDGLSSVAAAVLDGSGHVAGALYTYGPTFRFPDPSQATPIGHRISEVAAHIGAEIR